MTAIAFAHAHARAQRWMELHCFAILDAPPRGRRTVIADR